MKKIMVLMVVFFAAVWGAWAQEAQKPAATSSVEMAATTPAPTPQDFQWHLLLECGLDGPPSAGDLVGLDAGAGLGYNVTDQFSVWLDYNGRVFLPDPLTTIVGAPTFSLDDAALWARYDLTRGGVRPYILAGPGLAFNHVATPSGPALPPAVYLSETDFLAEWALGLDFRLAPGLGLLLQRKVSYDFLSSSFANSALAPDTAGVISYQLALEIL